MRTSKVIAFTVAGLAAAAASAPPAQAGWFWPLIGGAAARGAAATAVRTVATSTASRAVLGAAVVGTTAGYIAGAEASEGEGITKEQKYCININGQEIYYPPEWATNCFDGTPPRTEVTDLGKALN